MAFNPGSGDPSLCTFCTSPLFNTPDTDNQLIRITQLTVSYKKDIQNVQSRGPGLKTTALWYSQHIGPGGREVSVYFTED